MAKNTPDILLTKQLDTRGNNVKSVFDAARAAAAPDGW